MKKTGYILFFILLQASVLFAQKKQDGYTAVDEENMVFKNEWSVGARLHTNGFSAFYERVWIKSIWKKRVIQTNFFYFKDFKEKKVKSVYAQAFNAPAYFYGKQNNFWNVNFLYGNKKVIAEKADKAGVRLSMFYLGGVSLGILKPYALSIVERDEFNVQGIPQTEIYFYDSNNPSVFLSPLNDETRIYGAAGLRYGFNKIKPLPGVHAKFGFNFDWAGHEYLVKSIELGVQLDVYYKKIPVLISERNKPYILNLYMAFMLGKRW